MKRSDGSFNLGDARTSRTLRMSCDSSPPLEMYNTSFRDK